LDVIRPCRLRKEKKEFNAETRRALLRFDTDLDREEIRNR